MLPVDATALGALTALAEVEVNRGCGEESAHMQSHIVVSGRSGRVEGVSTENATHLWLVRGLDLPCAFDDVINVRTRASVAIS
jgi:hypothetical protein